MSQPVTELDALIGALLDRTITPEQMADLSARIRSDASAADRVAELMLLSSDASELMQSFSATAAPKPETSEANLRIARHTPIALSIAAALLLTAAAFAIYLFASGAGHDGVAPGPAGPTVGVLLEADGVVWNSDFQNAGTELTRNTYDIAGGTFEAELLGGANVRLTGPATVELASADRVFLHRGTLRARKDDGGFIVDLPGGRRVTDLGTEFEIDVDPAGLARIRVIEGLVRVDRKATQAAPPLAFNVEAEWRTELPADPAAGPIELVRDLPVVNGSFEADGGNRASGPLPSGWRSSIKGRAGCEDHVGNGNFSAGVDGRFVGLVNEPIASDPAGVESTLYQDTDHRVETGSTYRLSLSVGRRIDARKSSGPARWRIALTDADTGQRLAETDGVIDVFGQMLPQSLDLVVTPDTAGRRLRIELINPLEPLPGARQHQINFDDVRLERVVSVEPNASREDEAQPKQETIR